MSEGPLILAYHGCDVTVRDRLVRGDLCQLDPSMNQYDWLGDGAYFFEGDAERALSFAMASRDHPSKLYSAKPIVDATVVGAVLCVSRCWDMTTMDGRREYRAAYEELHRAEAGRGRQMPVNRLADADDESMLIRGLDCAIFNMGHVVRKRDGMPPYQMVRAAFYQGRPVVDSSEFRAGTHLQLAVRDPGCVQGWFLPRGLGLRLLSDEELVEADMAMADARRQRAAGKPRVRAAGMGT